jgi:hypothetical protein
MQRAKQPRRPTPNTEQNQPAKKAAPSRELLPVQQLIADEVADMLVHGGHESDIESLIFAALGHLHSRTYLQIHHKLGQWNDMECRDLAEPLIIRHAPEWKADLSAAWVENLRAEPRPEPADVVGLLRERVMDRLRTEFEEFLTHGSPEDHRLMVDVLNGVSNNSLRDASHAVTLGEEFNFQLGLNRGYLMVPGRLRRPVEEYIESLKAGAAARKPVLVPKTRAAGGRTVAEEEEDD